MVVVEWDEKILAGDFISDVSGSNNCFVHRGSDWRCYMAWLGASVAFIEICLDYCVFFIHIDD